MLLAYGAAVIPMSYALSFAGFTSASAAQASLACGAAPALHPFLSLSHALDLCQASMVLWPLLRSIECYIPLPYRLHISLGACCPDRKRSCSLMSWSGAQYKHVPLGTPGLDFEWCLRPTGGHCGAGLRGRIRGGGGQLCHVRAARDGRRAARARALLPRRAALLAGTPGVALV